MLLLPVGYAYVKNLDMIEYNPRSWPGILKRIQDIKDRHKYLFEGSALQQECDILYRGHGDRSWKLETTLERTYKKEITLLSYLQKATSDVEEVESFTNRTWNLPSYPDIENKVHTFGDFLHSLPCYEYLVYLRHCGFPSPLLDWSKSPYIALFFAVTEMANNRKGSLYAYIPTTTGCRGGVAHSPHISVHGPYVKAHQRHFTQKAWYTTSTMYQEGRHVFISHEISLDINNDGEQDVVYKINIPYNLKEQIIKYLGEHNINYFTIFHNEDNLIKAIAMKQFG